jgi:hypothetical protein
MNAGRHAVAMRWGRHVAVKAEGAVEIAGAGQYNANVPKITNAAAL